MVEQPSVSPDIPIAALVAAFGPNLQFARDLAPLTSFKTGGRARYFVSANTAGEIARAVVGAGRLGIPFFLLGGGSNVLVSDEGFGGLVIKVDVRGMKLLPGHAIESGAGEDLMTLVDFATANSLTGLEFAAGIWGSVGGAICGNAGAFGGEIGSVVAEITLVDRQGEIKTVTPEYCRFGYRDSLLKSTGEVVVTVRLRLEPGEPSAIRSRVDEILNQREIRHPVTGKSAGCFFKNIPDPSQPNGKLAAGKLLEEAGAKDLSVGDARVFDLHANIIVNDGEATSKDIRALADKMKESVSRKFGIELQDEVIQVGEF
ncbi:MAG TPA: UDP-N-acetylmuramate dehydrogenase [Acidobacteriota bacterium]|nr:UDP-N-acetylmuramate dehydrogenase [Acidobacteriota bacterium]